MGYRSNGLWVIKGPVKDVITAWMSCRITIKEPKSEFEDTSFEDFELYRVSDEAYIRFSYEDWKWYEDYPSVQFYNQVWGHLKTFEEHISGRRIRVGESDDDVDDESFGADIVEIGVSRSIYNDEFEYGEPLIPKSETTTTSDHEST
jgi:hypothetical protein